MLIRISKDIENHLLHTQLTTKCSDIKDFIIFEMFINIRAVHQSDSSLPKVHLYI
jgi:hypothetical protein